MMGTSWSPVCTFSFLVSLSLSSLFLLIMNSDCIRIASLNINGGRDGGKRALVYELMRQKAADVFFLQETHSDLQNATDWCKEWDGLTFLSHYTSSSAGVAVMFSRTFVPQSHSVQEIIRGRLLKIRATFENNVFVFICVYAPTSGGDRVAFLKRLSTVIRDCSPSDFVLIGGDLNCTADKLDRNHAEPHTLSRNQLIELISTYGLCDVWRSLHKTDRQYTWAHCRGNSLSLARLDRFYIFKEHLNKIRSCCIFPVGFSDHSMVMCNMSINNVKPRSAYWHFNTSMLDDVNFKESFVFFWNAIKAEKDKFSSLTQWWDVAKSKIKVFCQEYVFHVSWDVAQSLKNTELEIIDMQQTTPSTGNTFSNESFKLKKVVLSDLLRVKAQGALVRSRFRNFSEMDAPSRFFFGLEKKNSQKRYIHSVRSKSGALVSDASGIRTEAINFFSELYCSEYVDRPAVGEIFFQNLPTVSESSSKMLDKPLALDELEDALCNMQSGRAPGLDGLSVDFYKAFWPVLGGDFLEVVKECLEGGELPMSCRRAVLTLLPKKGDLNDLKNWRPVALLSTDYKIISKALATRLSKVMSEVIHLDQTYCVPDRSIFDNVHLVKGVLDIANLHDLRTGLISLDQTKAFDRVEHEYLWKTLTHFGFSHTFINMIKLLYKNIESMLKINGVLCAPFSVNRGVRQGCPLSGMLYSLAIEPFLTKLRENISGFSVPSCGKVFTLSAYADDVIVMVNNQRDIDVLFELTGLFGLLSSAQVNWDKSDAFLVGNWSGDNIRLPAGLSWKREGLKYLGVYLGDQSTMRKNWEGVIEKVKGRLSRWSWILPHVSYRGRVLIANNLVASALWHKLTCVDPPKDFLAKIQTLLVNFFWDNLHWLPQSVLYLPKDEGGQGLIHLPSRVAAFRLMFIQRFLTGPKDLLWRPIASQIFQSVEGLGMDRALFLMDTKRLNCAGLPTFYKGALLILSMFQLHRAGLNSSLHWLLEEPLLHGSRFDISTDNPTLSRLLSKGGVLKVQHLAELAGPNFSSSPALMSKMNIRSTRIVDKLLARWRLLLSTDEADMLRQHSEGKISPVKEDPFPPVHIYPRLENCTGTFLEDRGDFGASFAGCIGKAFYKMCVIVLNKENLNLRVDTPWRNVLRLQSDVRPEWRTLYKPPLRKQFGDLQWRLLHGILAMNAFVCIVNPMVCQDCPFCFQRETVFHCFMDCSRLLPLFDVLKTLFLTFGEVFSLQLFILGSKYTQRHRSKCQLINFVLGQAKMAIYMSRSNKMGSNLDSDCNVLNVFFRSLKSRILVDFHFFKYMKDLETFVEKWCYGEALCSVRDGEVVFAWTLG